MKRTNKCPKCGSKDVMADVKAVDRGESNWEQEFTVATFEHPDAMIFKGKRKSAVSAWVCGQCGYVELYVDSPSSLR